MPTLLVPGRHILTTAWQQAQYVDLLRTRLADLRFVRPPPDALARSGRFDALVFAVTSSNQSNSRYNPVDFAHRAIGVDRFLRDVRARADRPDLRCAIVGVPHYRPSDRFARTCLREIDEQTEGRIDLSPADTVVLTSTPSMIDQYAALGFGVLGGELDAPADRRVYPVDVVKRLGELGEAWPADAAFVATLSDATRAFLADFPDVPRRVRRLFRDPLLNDSGSLTESRDYNAYVVGMGNADILELKYRDVAPHLRGGKIVDEGCADGALLVPIARDFPDSDLIGIEITGELLAQCRERHRRGDFGGAFVHFHQRNLMEPIFEPASIDATLCNSTVHELWSYGQQATTVQAYLREKFRQTRPGGRLIIRDVVGPEHGDERVWLWLDYTDGSNAEVHKTFATARELNAHLEGLSTAARFERFATDFRFGPVRFERRTHDGKPFVELPLRDAAEFLLKKDYLDSWASEMKEQFCHWSILDWTRELTDAGFEVDPASRAYTNDWIVTNRFDGKASLHVSEHPARTIDWPPTNVILVARRGRG